MTCLKRMPSWEFATIPMFVLYYVDSSNPGPESLPAAAEGSKSEEEQRLAL